MLVLISPTKIMKTTGKRTANGVPKLYQQSQFIKERLCQCSKEELMKLLHIKEQVAIDNIERYHRLQYDKKGTCAFETYDGLQFKSMHMQEDEEYIWDYLEKHVRILSAMYGVVRPKDSVYPYRLEMHTRLAINEYKDVYAFWNHQLADVLLKELETHEHPFIVNLASKEYEKSVQPYINEKQWIQVQFYVQKNGLSKMESTQAKMARGRMVRYLAEHNISNPVDIQNFDWDGYVYDLNASNENLYIFVKKQDIL